MVRVSVHSSMSQGQEPGGGSGQCGVAVCCTFPPSARFGGLQALLLAPVLPASDFDVPPLSSEIFLTFTVGEEGMAVFVAAVTGSERPSGSLYLFGRLIFVFLTAFCISIDRFLFGSPSFSLAFSFIGYLYFSFSLACLSRATSSTGCPEYACKDIC